MEIGISDLQGKEVKRSMLGVRRSKVKVIQCQLYLEAWWSHSIYQWFLIDALTYQYVFVEIW